MKTNSVPVALAKNTIINDITIETASMLIVAPRGSASEEISLGTSISSAQRLLMGRVADDDAVPKAFNAAGSTVTKNRFRLNFPIPLTRIKP